MVEPVGLDLESGGDLSVPLTPSTSFFAREEGLDPVVIPIASCFKGLEEFLLAY
jgi:hypothetical protein